MSMGSLKEIAAKRILFYVATIPLNCERQNGAVLHSKMGRNAPFGSAGKKQRGGSIRRNGKRRLWYNKRMFAVFQTEGVQ